MIGNNSITYKALAIKASRLSTVSQKAALAALQLPVTKPTIGVISVTVGASASSVAKMLKRSPAECEAMLAGDLTLSDLAAQELAEVHANGSGPTETVTAEAFDTKQCLFSDPHPTVDEMLALYRNMTMAAQLAFGRAIGVDRVWTPRQRKFNGHRYISA